MKKLSKILVSLFLYILLTIPNINYININTQSETKNTKNILAINQKAAKHTLKNIAVFIEFKDSDANVTNHLDDEQSVKNAEIVYNSDELIDMLTVNGTKEEIVKVSSFKKYYERESYGDLNITTEIFPKIDGKVVSYTDMHPIGYYLKYSSANPIGYKNKTESLERETELINNAVNHISAQIESSGLTEEELDTNNDGKIDAISFIVEGQKNAIVGFNDLLWSHKLDNTGITNTILGKNVVSYNLLYATDYTESTGLFSLNRGGYGTLIHEFGHTLGFMDLYRYNSTAKPVEFYDIMGRSSTSNPGSFLTYFTSEYHRETAWHNPIPVITTTTNGITLTKPNYIDKNEKRAVKIEVGADKKEYFIIEYHEKMKTYETSRADRSGIIIYRVNDNNKYLGNTDGGLHGEKDHIYIFRPNETGLGNAEGDINKATLNMNRKTLGKNIDLNSTTFDPETIYFSNGKNSGIQIEVTNETTDSITFNVTYPKMEGTGLVNDPYLIKDAKTFIYHMTLNTKNKYYKLTSDIDFNEITDYPKIEFEGNLDGNNKTLKNIKTNDSGVFDSVGNFNTRTKIENLKIENIIAISSGQNHLGALSGSASNIDINNIQILNGTVTYSGNPINPTLSIGGFIGTAYNTKIENCSTNVDITAEKNIGGFIGLNQNAIIKNSFSSGKITGNSNIGGFIGLQAVTDTYYNTPENVYYNTHAFTNLKGTGGYVTGLHDLNVLNEESLSVGIKSVTIPENINVLINTKTSLPITITPSTSVNYEITIENETIAKYENNKIVALKEGTTKIETNIIVGTNKMKIESNLTVENTNRPLTEEEIISSLGLTKKGNYLIGFELGSKIEKLIKEVEQLNGVTIKNIEQSGVLLNTSEIIRTGMTFKINTNNKDYTYTVVIKGDVNGDGLIYATDYVKVKNHIMGKTTLTGPYLEASDINNDGNIYATDYVQIKNHIMGKSTITQK